jgi:uncharacterized secreted protein with C-terminal beta-propeller domain
VKTDGEYLYSALESSVVLLRAYPAAEAEVLSEIEMEGSPEGLYIAGDSLAVVETFTAYEETSIYYSGEEYLSYDYVSTTHIKIYDVSDRETPVLRHDITVDGTYWNSRRIGDYVYLVAEEPAYTWEDDVMVPEIYLDETPLEVPVEEILHPKEYAYSAKFVTLVSLNMQEEVESTEYLGYGVLLLGSNSNMYVSQDNIYLTCDEYDAETETTAIHRIHFDDGIMEYDATGEVPGTLLNQFSMDEYGDYFRTATTTGNLWDSSSYNHLYVLDENLEVVGVLEDLAPGETIYSARFLGDRAYLVTFRQVDPFFVIDLTDPENPTVLGELKITGYSDYLHPYDENHIIGIGKETVDGLYQGVKISLFDVTDVSNPTEIDKFVIGDRGTESPVLDDHKALLFDREKNLLVIPVAVAEIDESDYPYGVSSWAYGTVVWQGAYVLNISAEDGLDLRGTITHHDTGSDLTYDLYYYSPSSLDVERSLYIEDVLYTISDAKIKMNDLGTLDFINEVELTEIEP